MYYSSKNRQLCLNCKETEPFCEYGGCKSNGCSNNDVQFPMKRHFTAQEHAELVRN